MVNFVLLLLIPFVVAEVDSIAEVDSPAEVESSADVSDLEINDEADQEFDSLMREKSLWLGFNPETDINYNLWTRRLMWSHEELVAQESSFDHSNFDKDSPIRILIHGWNSDFSSMAQIKDAYLKQGDFNCIMIDWSLGSDDPLYFSSSQNIDGAARSIAKFIDFMHDKGYIKDDNVHIIGFSLDAHVAGLVGNYVKTLKIPVIVGLDPVNVMFSEHKPKKRIYRRNADYVAILHTSVEVGLIDPLGHADFYINYGNKQPGCGIDLLGACSHLRVVDVFAESIYSHNFNAILCSSASEIFRKHNCSKQGTTVIMSTETADRTHGNFLVHTKSHPPFAEA